MELRSRIKEEFSEEDMDFLHGICHSPYFDSNNEKADSLMMYFREKGFIELAPATNRFAVLKGNYVYKFAMDEYGIKDNINEFKLSKELQPYVTKTYETNGLITIAEYVNLIKEEEFVDSIPHIKEILNYLSESWLFSDVGAITKNHLNWGFRDDDSLVILDYGYFYHRDPKIMFCSACGGGLEYTENFDKLICMKCHKKYSVTDIYYQSTTLEDTNLIEKRKKYKGGLKISLGGVIK